MKVSRAPAVVAVMMIVVVVENRNYYPEMKKSFYLTKKVLNFFY